MKKYIGWNFSIYRPRINAKLCKDIMVAQLGNFITSLMGYFPLYLLSMYSNGIITAFNYGQRIIDIITNLITIQFLNVLGIRLNQVWAENRGQEIGNLFIRLTKSISLILIPLSFFISLYAREIIRLLFMRGKFDEHSAILSAQFLQIAVFMLPAAAINGIVAKCFMAAQKIQKCFIYQIVMGIIMMIFVFSFIKINGSFGYPLALSAFWWINVLTLFFIMKDNFPQIQYMRAVWTACRITIYVFPVVMLLYFIKKYFLSEHVLISCIVGAVGFTGVLLLAIKNNYLDEISSYTGGIKKLYATFIGNKS
jgi:peptidoglycan biosynthesis protein MviN/MurJ (putative lipid II flippase)